MAKGSRGRPKKRGRRKGRRDRPFYWRNCEMCGELMKSRRGSAVCGNRCRLIRYYNRHPEKWLLRSRGTAEYRRQEAAERAKLLGLLAAVVGHEVPEDPEPGQEQR